LFARLERRGVVAALTPAFDEYQIGLDHDRQALAAALGPADTRLWDALVAAGKRGRLWLTLSISAAVEAASIPAADARQVVRRVEEEGLTTVRAAGALQRYRVQRVPDRSSDLPALLQSVEAAIEGERRRLDAVRAYVLDRRCRQAQALAYLGERDDTPCGICDLCRGAAALEPAALGAWDWRPAYDPAAVRQLATLAPAPDSVGIARALCQVLTPRSRPYRRHTAWGSLERAPYGEVLAAVERTLASTTERAPWPAEPAARGE
jgi:hypothetical protein